jgi:pyridoxine 5-phosphate synthase
LPASGITIHLRGDRRHIQDEDVRVLRAVVKTHLNLEMAATEEMVRIACEIRPNTATLVPERSDEVTTEGGLDVSSREQSIQEATRDLEEAGVLVSIFVDPDVAQIEASHRVGAHQIEICTARYAELSDPARATETGRSKRSWRAFPSVRTELVSLGEGRGGHGLTYRNVAAIAEIYPIEELNIGHNIVARAALVGMERAVRDMIAAITGRV